jgi:hypothetical protein
LNTTSPLSANPAKDGRTGKAGTDSDRGIASDTAAAGSLNTTSPLSANPAKDVRTGKAGTDSDRGIASDAAAPAR